MNPVKSLSLGMRIAEKVWLSLLPPCISLPFACIFEDGTPEALAWAFLVILPVQAICLVCEKLKKKLHRFLASFAIAVAAFFLATTDLRSFYFSLCCLPILVAGVWVGRPGGKIVLTVPKLYHPLFSLLPYGCAQISDNALLRWISVGLAVVMLVVLILHRAQSRLLTEMSLETKAPAAARSMVRESRRSTLLFVGILVAVIVAVPLLLSLLPGRKTPERPPLSTAVIETQEPVIETHQARHGTPLPEGKPILRFVEPMIIVAAFFIVGFAFTILIIGLIHFLRRIRDDKDKIRNHGEEDLVVEALDVPPRGEKKKQEPEPKGYAKRIRRRFRKLIQSHADPEANLSPLTPAELARSAGLPEGEPAAQIRAVYEKARYSPDAVGREDYLALKEAIEAIEA